MFITPVLNKQFPVKWTDEPVNQALGKGEDLCTIPKLVFFTANRQQ
jgi:hypothetical protein